MNNNEVTQLPIINQEILNLWRDYVDKNITSHDVQQLAIKIREKALQVCNYKCLREYRFLETRIKSNHIYPVIIENASQKSYLDLGCCFGSDLRRLLVDGARIENIVGVEQFEEFIDYGCELYNDKEKLKSRMFVGNFLQDDFVVKLQDKIKIPVDVVHAGSILHLLYETEVNKLINTIYTLLKLNGYIFGQTVADTHPHLASVDHNPNGIRYLHSPTSLKDLLASVGFVDIIVNWKQNPEGDKWGTLFFSAKKP